MINKSGLMELSITGYDMVLNIKQAHHFALIAFINMALTAILIYQTFPF